MRTRNRFLVALCVCAALLGMITLAPPPARAAFVNVPCSVSALVTAINNANANPDADTLNLASGCVYNLTAVDNTGAQTGPNGLPVIASSVTLHGNNATFARDSGAPAFRILQINSGAVLSINNLTVRDGQAGAGEHHETYGGGIYNAGTLYCEQCVIRNNTAGASGVPNVGGNGGGIFNSGTLTLLSATLRENQAGVDLVGDVPGYGGGIYNTGSVQIVLSTLQQNYGGAGFWYGGHAGAIYNDHGTVTLDQSVIADNAPGHGGTDGGLCGAIENDGGSLSVNASIFTRNRAEMSGGAICSSAALYVNDSYFAENYGSEGGAIYASGGEIHNSTFAQNASKIIQSHCYCVGGEGGAIWGEAYIDNSTFTQNTAERNGGAIFGTANLVAVHSTFASNTAYHAQGVPAPDGGMYGGTARNSIFTNNVGGNCAGVSDGGGNVRWPRTDTSCVGKYGAPKLGALQNNGGAVETMALAPDSQAINAGADANCLAADARGIARPQGAHCDSGAFELEPPTALALNAPPDGTKTEKSQIQLRWNVVQRIAFYRVIVRRDAPDGTKVINVKLDTNHYLATGLESGHTYYWFVKACSKVACVRSAQWKFRAK